MAYTTINKSTDYFNTKLWAGTGSSNAVTGIGHQPDWVWIKDRTEGNWHDLYDAVRGITKRIYSNTTSAEETQAQGLTAFGTDGFTVGSNVDVNKSGNNYVAWNWKAGTTAVPSGGTITPSACSFNTTSGFGMYKYVGNTTSGATIAHGLGVIPKFIMVKSTDQTSNWQLQHVSTGPTKYLELNSTIAAGTATSRWNDTAPTSTVFSLGNTNTVNDASYTYIAYVWADVKGYSKFGSYTGNGNADGTFVYTGFQPAWVVAKRTSGTGGWRMWDNKREGYNGDNVNLYANLANAEESDGTLVDFCSQGFKWRGTSVDYNGSGSTYVYAAFAKHPLVSSNNIPGTAR